MGKGEEMALGTPDRLQQRESSYSDDGRDDLSNSEMNDRIRGLIS